MIQLMLLDCQWYQFGNPHFSDIIQLLPNVSMKYSQPSQQELHESTNTRIVTKEQQPRQTNKHQNGFHVIFEKEEEWQTDNFAQYMIYHDSSRVMRNEGKGELQQCDQQPNINNTNTKFQLDFNTNNIRKKKFGKLQKIDRFKSVKEKPKQKFVDSNNRTDGIPKCFVVTAVGLIFITLSIIEAYLVYNMSPSRPVLKSPVKQIMISRNFQKGRVYYNNFIVTTESNTSTIKINYTLLATVKECQREQTHFIGVLQKRSQQLYDQNGTFIREITFDTSDIFYRIVKYGDTSPDNYATGNTTTDNNATDNSTAYNTTLIPKQPILPIFRFVLYSDGKIKNFTFHKNTEKETLGLQKSFVKMFSPNLVKDLYVNARKVSKIKYGNENMRRLLQQWMNETEGNFTNKTNGTDDPNQKVPVYAQQQGHGFQTEENSTSLNQQSSVNYTGPSHNSMEQSVQSSNFSKQGQLTSATLQSNSQFNSIYQQPNENYAVHNFDINTTSVQTAEMNLMESYKTNMDYVIQLEALIAKYENQSNTYTLTTADLMSYIIGAMDGEGNNPGDVRMLLEADGSLKIIGYDKQVSILNTNVVGFQIAAYGYLQLKLLLYQDPKDQYKKTPKIIAGAGTILSLGFFKQKVPVLDYKKELPPLTLKFTLQQIEKVANLFKGNFIGKVIQLSKKILNGDFENNLIPNIMNVVSMIEDVQRAVQAEENTNSPVSIILKILSSVSDIRAIVDSKGLDLLNPQNQFAQSLTGELLSYFNVSFAEALDIFNKVKGNLSLIRSQGSDYLVDIIRQFPTNKVALVERQIRNLIPAEVYSDYQRQIEKAKSIVDFLTFVKQKGLQYSSYVELALDEHSRNMVGLVKGVVDLYFRNQTNITDTFVRNVTGRFGNVLSEFEQFKKMKERVNVTQMTARVQQLFESMLFDNLLSGYYRDQFGAKFDYLHRRTQGVRVQRGQCCRYKKKRKMVFFRVKVCIFFNPAYGAQSSENIHLDALRKSVENVFNSLVNQIQDALTWCKQILADQQLDIVRKFYELKPRIDQIQNLIPLYRFDDIITKINDRQAAAKQILPKIGCGGSGNLHAYIAQLGDLSDFVTSFKNRYNELKQVSQSIVDKFNDTIYTAILDNTVIIQSATQFFNLYKSYEDSSLQFFSNIKQIANSYDPKKFAESADVALQVFRLYGVITKSLNELCINKDDNRSSVEAVRQTYNQKLSPIRNMSNVFFSGQLLRLTQFLGNSSDSMFSVFVNTPFCQIKTQFENQISALFPDFDNFTLLFELYSQMQAIKSTTINFLQTMKSKMRGLSKNFFSLFTPLGYRNFVKETQNLAIKMEQLTDNVSLHLSRLRESAKTIYMFQMSAPSQITTCLQVFANSSFVLSSYDMFHDLNAMVFSSLDIIDSLSFDVIAFVVAAKDVLQYFEETISNFRQGASKVLSSFKDLCQSFIDVTALVRQQYLNNINRDFRNIIVVLNETIFPNITQKLNSIVVKFEGYEFRSQYLAQLFSNSMNRLVEYGEILEKCKIDLFTKMKEFSDLATKLIENLQIGSLNSIYQLTNVIRDEFSAFFSSFPSMLRELLDFKTLVNKDFRKVFSFKAFFSNVQQKVQARYATSVNNILTKINQTEGYLSQNSKFYNKFKASSVYRDMTSAKNEFVLDFQSIWNEANGELTKIDQFLNEISGSVAQILKELNEAKEKMSQIKSNVEGRIKNIKFKYQLIRKKFFNIQSLFFIALRTDLSETVAECLRSISAEFDNIIDIDLAAVDELTKSALNNKVRIISELISNAKVAYNILRNHRDAFFEKIVEGVAKIDEFIEDNIVSKFQKLKDGILMIKSQTNLQDAASRMVLWQSQDRPKRVPLFSFSQPIPTPIGVFYLKLQINYTLSARAFVAIRQFRSIDIGVTFEAALILQLSFSYGIAYILEFGFYLRGSILRASVTPSLGFNGVIPMQLLKPIADISELTSQNKAEIVFAIDLAINAVEMQVGFYIKHIWLEIIWIDIDLCFDFWFFSFCISLRLPIGFRIIFKRHDWGYTINGIAILKKRILELSLIKWSY